MAKKKEITIDALAGMVQRGFLAMEEKMEKGFNSLNERVDGVEKRLVSIEQRLDALESRMSFLEASIGELNHRIDTLEESNEEIVERLGRIEQLVDENQQERIKRLEEAMYKVYETLALKWK